MDVRFNTSGRNSQSFSRFSDAHSPDIAEPHSLPIDWAQALQPLFEDLNPFLPCANLLS